MSEQELKRQMEARLQPAVAAMRLKEEVVTLIERVRACELLARGAGLDATLILRLEGARHDLDSVETLARLALRQHGGG